MAEPAPALRFEDHGLRAGIWHGRLTGGVAPARLLLMLDGRLLTEAAPEAEESGGGWRVAMPVPAEALGEGLRVPVLLADAGPAGAPPGAEAQRLAALTLSAGAPLDGDMAAEIALLRAELELLKQVVRRLAGR